jgi:hypothetical protein
VRVGESCEDGCRGGVARAARVGQAAVDAAAAGEAEPLGAA